MYRRDQTHSHGIHLIACGKPAGHREVAPTNYVGPILGHVEPKFGNLGKGLPLRSQGLIAIAIASG